MDEKSENTTTLTNAIVSTDTAITVGSTSDILQDYVIKIGDEHMLVESVPSSTTLNVKRGYGYTSDDVNSYTLLVGENHLAASTITISNGDWIQAELVPKESVNNIKSLKLMFVQAKIETTSTTIYSDEIIDMVDNSIPYQPATQFAGSNFTTNDSSIYNYIKFLTYYSNGSNFDTMTFTGNDTQIQEWTRPEYDEWVTSNAASISLGNKFFLRSYVNVLTANIEINIKKDLGLQYSQTGNVPKGFQINDMSIIYRTKNVK